MNNYFDEKIIQEYYPGAEEYMFPPMLIWKLPAGKENKMSDVCDSGEYFAQEKKDGALYVLVKGTQGQMYLFGRTISRTTGLLTEKGANVPHIISAFDCIPNGTAIIGEIYYPGKTAKNVVEIMGCLAEKAIKRQEERGLIHYYIHDIVFYNGLNLMDQGALDRYQVLQELWNENNLVNYDFLSLANNITENIESEISNILKNGGEGMVLKKKDGIYAPGKRTAWLTIKAKQMDSTDLVCTRLIPATKEYTGKEIESWPYWEKDIGIISTSCMYDSQDEGWIPVTKPYALGWYTSIGIGAYDENGNLKEIGTVSSGLTDEDKKNMTENPDDYLNHVCSLDCMLLDKKDKTLRHPVFRAWRQDKNPEECRLKDIF